MEYYISSNKYSLQERQTKRGRVYDVVFRIVTLDGNEKQKKLSGFTTKALAKQAYVDFVTTKCELVKNNPIKKKAVDKKIPTVDELISEYIASLFNQNKASSIYNKRLFYNIFVLPQFGSCKINSLTKEVLYRWQDSLWSMKNEKTGQPYSYNYLSSVRAAFCSFLSWCESRYGYKNHFTEIVKPKRRAPKTKMQIWTREQFEQFISTVDNPMYHALFTLLFFTGRRKGEIFALTPVQQRKQIKRRKCRFAPPCNGRLKVTQVSPPSFSAENIPFQAQRLQDIFKAIATKQKFL